MTRMSSPPEVPFAERFVGTAAVPADFQPSFATSTFTCFIWSCAKCVSHIMIMSMSLPCSLMNLWALGPHCVMFEKNTLLKAMATSSSSAFSLSRLLLRVRLDLRVVPEPLQSVLALLHLFL